MMVLLYSRQQEVVISLKHHWEPDLGCKLLEGVHMMFQCVLQCSNVFHWHSTILYCACEFSLLVLPQILFQFFLFSKAQGKACWSLRWMQILRMDSSSRHCMLPVPKGILMLGRLLAFKRRWDVETANHQWFFHLLVVGWFQ